MQVTASLQTNLQEKWSGTSLGWQQENLKIVNKAAELVSYHHNISQRMLMNAKQKQRHLRCPIRIIIVKARQKGLSTGESADVFEDVNRHSNVHACLVSMDTDGTEKVFRMSQTFQTNMPDARFTIKSNKKQIVYAEPHNSSILCQTAGKETLGRGGTCRRGHYTEVAFWANAEKQIMTLLAEIPKTPESSVVIESTAFGTVGAFHNRYLSAIDRVRLNDFTGFIPLFVPWFVDDEYSMTIPKGVEVILESDHESYGDEVQLVKKHGLTLAQMYWRRWMIQNDFDNDLSWFMQEYPSTWREAFQGTGRQVFRPSDIDRMEESCRAPAATVEFYRTDEGKVRYRDVNRRANCWSVWQWPSAGHSYVGFADVAEGVLSDQNNPKSDPDRSVGGMMDRNQHSVPIVYYGRPDTIEFADQFWLACEFYNFAWASPEMNSIGQSVLDAGKRANYPYIYQREHKEEEVVREDSKKYGWKTTTLTRKPMIADLQSVVKEGELTVYDKRIIDELRTFIWNKAGKAVADVGEHDDCVIFLAGLLQLHQRCPLNENDLSIIDEPKGELKNVAVAGQTDQYDDLDDNDPYDAVYSTEEFVEEGV